MIQMSLTKQKFFNASALRTGVLSCLLPLALGASVMLSAPHAHANQAALKGVKTEISRQQQQLTSSQKKLNQLQNELKKHELAISNQTKKIHSSEQSLRSANKKLSQYQTQHGQLEKQKQQQAETLKELVKTYYITRRKYDTATLFQGDDKAELDRISHYFQHLAKQRAEAITALNKTESQIDATHQALKQEQQQIASLLETQKKRRSDLQRSQKNRKQTLAKIQGSIKNDKNYLAELQRNENRLKAEIAKAAKRNAVPMDGIAKQRGKLPWPLKGKTLHSFGTKQTGQVSWKGMVIAAKYEQPVKSVYSGTVVFAEYLRGYGLVVLLDHGKGDMTLYGFNQTLLKKEGDKVRAGETIALAGDTGGQDRASLYFEIRRNSEAQNPKKWLRR